MSRTLFIAAALLVLVSRGESQDQSPLKPVAPFSQSIAPFLQKYCNDCHGGDAPEAKLGLDRYTDSANIQEDYNKWEKVLRMSQAQQMPPSDSPQPTSDELMAFIEAVQLEMNGFDCSGASHPGRVTIRRLNKVEYNNTIRDLVGVTFRPADDFPADDVGNGFDNIGDVLSLPPVLMEKYLDAAERIIDEAYADEKLRALLFKHTGTTDEERREALRKNYADFARRAFRRPVTSEEVSEIYNLRRAFRSVRLTEEQANLVPFKVILASPQFLFRVEADPARGEAVRMLNSHEIATRLSYFLWSTMPDDELFELANQGKLTDPEVLAAQVKRMLADHKSIALVDNFAGQWLQLRDVTKVAPDPQVYPDFDDELRQSMLQETRLFFQNIIAEDRSVLDFLNGDYSFVNARLAKHYGIEGSIGEEFQRVSTGDQRRGILTHASILTLTSNPTRTSPVKRGKWILENILGEPPPPPPPAVPELEKQELLGTLRERMEQHRADPSCAVCHYQMDTLGFGLENFDGIGAWRDRDGRFEIDPAGSLPGGLEFAVPSELMQILSQQRREAFSRCLTEKMLTYALGRGLVTRDLCAVRGVLSKLEAGDYHFSSLVIAIVQSDPFLKRESAGDQ